MMMRDTHRPTAEDSAVDREGVAKPPRRGSSRLLGAGYKLASYGATTLLLGAVGLVQLPMVIGVGGESVWVAYSLGQSAGVVLANISGLGWVVTGPASIARASSTVQRIELARSVTGRLIAGLVLLALTSPILVVVCAAEPAVAVLAAAATVATSLSSTWFFVGKNSPVGLLLWDTIPRTVFTVAGLLAMFASSSVQAGLWVIVVGTVACPYLFLCRIYRRSWRLLLRDLFNLRAVWSSSARNSSGVGISLVSSLSMTAPLWVAAMLLSPTSFAQYALIDKVSKQILMGTSPIVNVLQGWVPNGPDGSARASRARISIVLATAAALCGCICMIIAGSLIYSLLSAGVILVSGWIAVLSAVMAGSLFLQRVVVRSALVPVGLDRIAFIVSTGSTIAGLALGALAALYWGIAGLIGGVVFGQILAILIGAIFVWKVESI